MRQTAPSVAVASVVLMAPLRLGRPAPHLHVVRFVLVLQIELFLRYMIKAALGSVPSQETELLETTIGVNSYWAQGLKPPPHFYDHGARLYDEPPPLL